MIQGTPSFLMIFLNDQEETVREATLKIMKKLLQDRE
jgi:hypothetical protein